VNALQLFKGTNMYKCVDYLIKDLKESSFKFSDIDFYSLIQEFKASSDNKNIEGVTLKEQTEILLNKLYCYIIQKLSKERNIEEGMQHQIRTYIEGSIKYEIEEDSIIEGVYQKKYLKYKNKYLNLKNKSILIQNNNQIGGVHHKVIFPRNIPTLLPNESYTNYLKNFINYVSANLQFNNLWMIIGANNTNSYGFVDLDRFSRDFDITINGNYLININEQNLLSLYSCDEDIQKLELTKDLNVYSSSYGVKNVYELLVRYLPNKFDQIVYDWSTTKFILDDDKIFSELDTIKKLIGLNGRLYIDTFRRDQAITLFFSKDAVDVNKYYIQDQNYDSITKISTSFIITPEIIEKYLKYNSSYIFYFNSNRIYDINALFQYMQPDGGINKREIDDHIKHIEIHQQNEISRFNDETMRRLNEIFSNKNFIINYETNPKFEYPNNPDKPNKKINNFYFIRRIAL